MITVALTGCHGFVAKNLAHKLKCYEFDVVELKRRLLYNPMELNDFFRQNKPNYIIHTAAYGNKFDQKDDYENVMANIVILTNLLTVANGYNYTGFVNFSSSSVTLPYETFYSATKAAGERIARAFVNKYDKPIISVRPYTIIGKGEQKEHLIPKLIDSCQKQTPMDFVSSPTHDYIGVSDLCEAVIKLMQYTQTLKGQVIDIGTGISTKNSEVKQIVEKLTGKKANTNEVKQLRPYDIKDWKANPVVLEYLMWKPKQTLEQIISDMVDS